MLMSERALTLAQAGDEEAFRELTDPHRRELQLHCYRILGSIKDAEDILQETLLAAWRGLDQVHMVCAPRSPRGYRPTAHRISSGAGAGADVPRSRLSPRGRRSFSTNPGRARTKDP
jgi:RNA polymerase sigma-70 factor (ECF subfamily)